MKSISAVLTKEKLLFLVLFVTFCFSYPFAVTGIAFDVKPPFSLAWAGSALLFLEGSIVIVAACVRYGMVRGFVAGLVVIIAAYMVEAVGVGTGFPFGSYRYTPVLLPHLPGNVPLAVMFAWVLIVFGVYEGVHTYNRPLRITDALLGALLAMLLDLEIEPVASHLEQYWEWLAPGRINYYAVPLVNFVAWFVVAAVLLFAIDKILFRGYFYYPSFTTKHLNPNYLDQLIWMSPTILFCTSLFMFGLIDITHGYYWAALPGILAVLLLLFRSIDKKKKKYA